MYKSKRLTAAFYEQTDVVSLAKTLIGKILVSEIGGHKVSGIITETEAYRAPDDRASHAWGDRKTPRTEVMFRTGGCAYVYLCYGIHHLFNVVTGPEGVAHAVLIRAAKPLEGVAVMRQRRGTKVPIQKLAQGPGALGQAFGFHTRWSGQSLITPDTPVWIEATEDAIEASQIRCGKRIGIDYAGACAEWPWRFWLEP